MSFLDLLHFSEGLNFQPLTEENSGDKNMTEESLSDNNLTKENLDDNDLAENKSSKKRDLLKVEHLKKYFATKKGLLHAVDDITFTIKKGETLGLVGESGCGKSTAGRAILRLHEPTSGKVFLDDVDVTELKGKKNMHRMRQQMQIVFQDPYSSLNPRNNTFDLIADPLHVNKLYKSRAELESKVYMLMELVGLEPRLADSFPHELDGGRRQRIGIARALALQPEFIVMDEPVSALDVSIQAQVLNLMAELQESLELTYLFISHDLSVVRHISDRIAVMYLGKIVELTDYKSIFTDPLHPYTQALLSAIPIPKYGLKRERIILKGDVPSPINPPAGCRFYARCPIREESCLKEHPPLEEKAEGHFCACHLVKAKDGFVPKKKKIPEKFKLPEELAKTSASTV